MEPLKNISSFALKRLKAVLFDVDDTITNYGKLTDTAYSAMWKLYRAGLMLIPVTGRPAGWCDMMLRQWPVDAVVCENGAFVFDTDEHGSVRMIKHPLAAEEPQKKLEAVKQSVLKAFPDIRMAHDQFARIYDAAFDFAEDEPKLGMDTAYAVAALCKGMGAEAKVSSIHVNAWFGGYSKADMAISYLKEHAGITKIEEEAIFIGDSPNDEPMFRRFALSAAVSNITKFADKLEFLPKYIAKSEGGFGFAEISERIIQCIGQNK